MSAQVPSLRPLGFGEILDVAIKIFTRNAKTLLKLVLFVILPVNVVSALVLISLPDSQFDLGTLGSAESVNGSETVTFDTEGLGPWLAANLVTTILALLATWLATAACFNAIVTAYLGERPNWLESLRFAGRRLHSVVWVSILALLLPAIGLFFCILPGVWLYCLFVLSVPVLLTEGLKGRRALGRSRRLVRGRWWNVFGVIVVSTVLALIVSGVLGALAAGASFANQDNTALNVIVQYVADTIGQAFTVPFTAAVVVVLYVDLRVRKEAFDLQLLASSIGIEGETAAPAETLFPVTPVVPAAGATRPADDGEQPPFWPPPPGWKPPSDRT